MNAHAASCGTSTLSRKELAIIFREIARPQIRRDILRYSGIESRHIFHDGNGKAVDRLVKEFDKIGGPRVWVRREEFIFRKDQRPNPENVVAMLPGVNSDEVVILAAHLDCTAERDPSYRPEHDAAPGADDDASGIAGVLAAARAILALADAQPAGGRRAEIRFIFFNAEEMGQHGSREYVKQEDKLGTSISAMYAMDMIGYRHRRDSEFEVHAGFKRNSHVQAASLEIARHLIAVCAAANIPLKPRLYYQRGKERDPGQGFSDHTSFHRRGYPAIMISENFFPAQVTSKPPGHPNPDYHMPEDTANNLDFRYTTNIVRAVTAAAWHWATRPRCIQGHAPADVHDHEAQESPEHDTPTPHEH
jgi:leucyl aminopeptidase